MRLDKFLCDQNKGSRSKLREQIRKGLAAVNGQVVRDPGAQIVPEEDLVTFRGEAVTYCKYVHYMLNKPAGVVSATRDRREQTVLQLLETDQKGLFPVGRLDKDTEGLLLITNDGELAHQLLSPTKHVDKTYLVTVKRALKPAEIEALEQGVLLSEREKPTLPGKVEVLSETQIYLTIHEGRFHQVKRMLQAVDNEVLALKRIRFGPLALDPGLAPGESRPLSPEETALLYQ